MNSGMKMRVKIFPDSGDVYILLKMGEGVIIKCYEG